MNIECKVLVLLVGASCAQLPFMTVKKPCLAQFCQWSAAVDISGRQAPEQTGSKETAGKMGESFRLRVGVFSQNYLSCLADGFA